MPRCAWSLCAALSLGGCGGAARPVSHSVAVHGENPSTIKAEVRRDRRTIRDLKNEISLLRAQVRDGASLPGAGGSPAIASAAAPPPPAPAPAPAAPGPEDSQPASDYHGDGIVASPGPDAPLPQTLGDDVEVIYEGAAARDDTVRPRLTLHETTRESDGHDVDSGGPERDPLPAVAEGPATRLPVTRGRVPTVADQLRHQPASAGGAIAQQSSAAPAAPAAQAPAAPAPSPAQAAAAATAEYHRLIRAVRGGNYVYAAEGLRGFLDHHPPADLADNAQYWLAETFYARARYSLAEIEFQKVIDRYPRGNKVPDALLKIAYCRLRLGHKRPARTALHALVAHYPRSNPAALARDTLKEMNAR